MIILSRSMGNVWRLVSKTAIEEKSEVASNQAGGKRCETQTLLIPIRARLYYALQLPIPRVKKKSAMLITLPPRVMS